MHILVRFIHKNQLTENVYSGILPTMNNSLRRTIIITTTTRIGMVVIG